ncbi:MAG: hypothetical protein A2504_16845 [Bdellovibrionales bacterium RIFOXYD12_FULL_39_22]|nr:MAG: hypothetical protein A2385_12780 [Bdellovibrionales bacterium RIFOXYB1_FULL_39_21]OFZ42474.1 MAG: hypothetical protein A2485_04135 [Bdellovibrionales bacterium RIFOXYC12_FULL_39_17]OFZ45776.1 MAG: hypothetical protein A2404_17540 [Bdellovibrionales bacterium RIFOXYC1_FULL_39_130]OFZ74673.1 MAG: hypothetical protein A2560_08350 [Bdellovibrionales bacterium RIFOXYD1_FULL_39_84]OFZ94359.1 MAG: hypothetical protein A2504_16845 [Bdellovibrionales bacterium RIFOXYD12_FULL_39_22]HLE11347.1 hy
MKKILLVLVFLIWGTAFAEDNFLEILRTTYRTNSTQSEFGRKIIASSLNQGVITNYRDCKRFRDISNKAVADKVIKSFEYLYKNNLALVPFDTNISSSVATWISKEKMIVDNTREISLLNQLSTKTCKINPKYEWERITEFTENDCKQSINCDYLNLINYISEKKIEIAHQQRENDMTLNIDFLPTGKDLNDFFESNQPICI